MTTGAITPLLTFICFIDTLWIYFPRSVLPPDVFNRIRSLYGLRPRHFTAGPRGVVLMFQCPSRKLIQHLVGVCEQYDGLISRLDIACDVLPDPSMTALQQLELIKRHVVLRGRRAQPIIRVKNEDGSFGFYFKKPGRPKAIDLVGYCDLASKHPLLGVKPCAHLDLRIRRHHAWAIKPSDLVN